jgi:hypothetical protein
VASEESKNDGDSFIEKDYYKNVSDLKVRDKE